MRKLYFLLGLLWGWMSLGSLAAQTVSGKLVDENNRPLPYANVVVLSLPDSAFVSGTVSGEDGTFALPVAGENRLVKISSIGYVTAYRPASPSALGLVQMEADAQLLGEVVVKADLPKVQLKGGAVVTTVSGSVLEKAGTGNDLLDKIPGVSAKKGKVDVFGCGAAEIYINGRKMRNVSELDQLSSDNIKRVEVLRNPGARYDASVKAVVRIFTKKPQGEGFGFSNRTYAAYQYDWSLLEQFNFNYRRGGLDLGGMLLGLDNRTEDNKLLVQKTYLDKTWEQYSNMEGPYHTRNVAARWLMNYQFNDRHIMGMQYDFDRYPQMKQQTILLTSLQVDKQLDEESESRSYSAADKSQHSVDAYYNGEIGDWQLDLNADAMWSDREEPSTTREIIRENESLPTEHSIHTFERRDNRLYATKLVVGHPLWEGDFSIGGEYSYACRKNRFTNQEGILDNNLDEIKENAVSAFIEYARSFGKLQAQAGVRYEYLRSNYSEDNVRVDEQSRTYNNVFPSLTLSYPIGQAQLMLSYAGTIYRPSYYQLSGGVSYANRYTYEGGNPLLRSSIINTLSLNTSWKWVYLDIAYKHIKDMQIQVSRAYSAENPAISLLTHINAPHADLLNATLSLSPTIGCWSPQFNAMLRQQWFNVDTPDGRMNFSNPMGIFQWNNTFSLPKGFQLGLNMVLSTRGEMETVRILNTTSSVDFSLYKGFMNDRLTFQLQAEDLFHTSGQDVILYSGNRTTYVSSEPRRSFTLTVRYKFNAAKSKYRGTGAGESQKSRM